MMKIRFRFVERGEIMTPTIPLIFPHLLPTNSKKKTEKKLFLWNHPSHLMLHFDVRATMSERFIGIGLN